jgi:mannose-6-phosphate isomerase
LGESVKKDPQLFGLREGEVFPLIVSMTAADEDLSIQVHPTDEFARKVERLPYGKSEAWFFLNPPTSGSIIAGQTAETTELFKEAVRNQSYERILNRVEIEAESMVYIPSGTIHALTEGALVYEIQQATDITYRFYDYDRLDNNGVKRELHTEQALAAVNSSQTVTRTSFRLGEMIDVKEFKVQRRLLMQSYCNNEKIAQVITLLSGTMRINNQTIRQGQSIIVFPSEKITIEKSGECMIATPKAYWRETSG